MNPLLLASEPVRRLARWLAGLALLLAVPKCFLCAAAWLGLGALLGLGQPEICGAPASSWRRDHQSREFTAAISRGANGPASIISFTPPAAVLPAAR
jgi:hypothetical protein